MGNQPSWKAAERLPGAIAHLSKESRTPAGFGAIGEHSDCGSRTPRVGCGGGHSLPAPVDPHSGAGAARYSEANVRSRTDPAAASTGCRGSVRHRPGSCLVRMGRIRASLRRRITVINSERRARGPEGRQHTDPGDAGTACAGPARIGHQGNASACYTEQTALVHVGAFVMNARAIRHVRIAYERFNVAAVPQRSSRAELSHRVTVVS
jgi:hypothetical protein